MLLCACIRLWMLPHISIRYLIVNLDGEVAWERHRRKLQYVEMREGKKKPHKKTPTPPTRFYFYRKQEERKC